MHATLLHYFVGYMALCVRSLFLPLSLFLSVSRYSAARNRDLYYTIDITFRIIPCLPYGSLLSSVISDLKSAFVKFDLPTRVYQINGECIGENMNRW